MVKAIRLGLLLFLFFTLVSCSFNPYNNHINNNDWSFTLKNGYEISHINSEEIVCGKKSSKYSSKIIVGEYITKFIYNENYVFLQYLDQYDDNLNSFDVDEFKYARVNFYTDETTSWNSYTSFSNEVKEKNVLNLNDWIKTKPRPNNTSFD